MNTESGPRLEQLRGLPLSRIGCACDMLWLQFGELTRMKGYQGRTKEVGEFGLHVSIPWRFAGDSRILIGNRDLYFYPNGDRYEFDETGGESRFHVFAASFNDRLVSAPLVVESVSPGDTGGLALGLSGSYTFEAFPNVSHDSPGFEFWRLLQPGSAGPHLVRGTDVG